MGVVDALQESVELAALVEVERAEKLIAAGGGAGGQRLHEGLSGGTDAEIAPSGVGRVDGANHKPAVLKGVQYRDEVAAIDACSPRQPSLPERLAAGEDGEQNVLSGRQFVRGEQL